MPKVILTECERRNEALREYINSRIGRGPGQFRNISTLADAVKIPYSSFQYKMKAPAERFSHYQVTEILRVTRATDRDAARVTGTKYRGRTAESEPEGERLWKQ